VYEKSIPQSIDFWVNQKKLVENLFFSGKGKEKKDTCLETILRFSGGGCTKKGCANFVPLQQVLRVKDTDWKGKKNKKNVYHNYNTHFCGQRLHGTREPLQNEETQCSGRENEDGVLAVRA
jgi:hypothetical protein